MDVDGDVEHKRARDDGSIISSEEEEQPAQVTMGGECRQCICAGKQQAERGCMN